MYQGLEKLELTTGFASRENIPDSGESSTAVDNITPQQTQNPFIAAITAHSPE